MKKAIFIFGTMTLIGLLALLSSCSREKEVHISSAADQEIVLLKTFKDVDFHNYTVSLPNYLKSTGMDNPVISGAKASLGRVLFYDKQLSADGQISCASCHKPEQAFSDDKPFSTGIYGRKTSRNSPPLANVANFAAHYASIQGKQPLLFWDERAETVEQQAAQTFANPHEMGLSMQEVVDKVKAQEYYPILWKRTYPDGEINEQRVLDCIAEFVGAVSACNSRFDQAMESAATTNIDSLNVTVSVNQVYYGNDTIKTVPIKGFSLEEFEGMKLFVKNCSKCHSPIRPFQEVFAACNGLDINYTDNGIGAFTGNTHQNGVFKSPSLRNIALTAPYMHDGRFKTLEEVVEFYSTGVKSSPNLHNLMLANGSPLRHFSEQEKKSLVAFMRTLTDQGYSTSLFSDPFN